MTTPNDDIWKVCATCRHCKIVGRGQEIPHIAESEFIEYYCDKRQVSAREEYLMHPVDEEINSETPNVCPDWEALDDKIEMWQAEQAMNNDLTFYDETLDGGIEEVEMAWSAWLEANAETYPLIASQLGDIFPRLLRAISPVIGLRSSNAAIWKFYMQNALDFLCKLPAFNLPGASLLVPPTPKKFAFFWSDVWASFVDECSLLNSAGHWDCLALLEHLDPWPSNAVEWTMWLLSTSSYSQSADKNERLLGFIDQLMDFVKGYEVYQRDAGKRSYLLAVLGNIKEFLRACSW